MPVKIVIPRLGQTMTEGTVSKWLKNDGDRVEKDEDIYELEYDKATVNIGSPATGILKTTVPGESTRNVGEEIGLIMQAGEETPIKEMPKNKKELAGEKEDADVIVVGGGPGGYVAAIRLAQLGTKVLLIEKDRLGGTCLNRGCIPTKALLQSAEMMEMLADGETMGIKVKGYEADIPAINKRKNQVVEQLVSGVGYLLKARNVSVVYGNAVFIGEKELEVTGKDGKTTRVTAKNILIACGSKPASIPIPGIDGKNVITSNEALDLENMPESMLIIGGGVIGVELGSIYANFGAKITIVEIFPQLLPNIDEEIAKTLEKSIRKHIDVYTSTKVLSIGDEKGKKSVRIQTPDGKEKSICADKVLVSTGRTPDTQGLNIEGIGIKTVRKCIEVDENFETSVKGVYAIGDVTGGIQLAHMASAQGIVAAEKLMGYAPRMNLNIVPACIYTSPEIACVGITEKQAKEKGIEFTIGRFPFKANGKALAMGKAEGFVKIIADKKYGEILGVHMIGPRATDMIGEMVAAMRLEATVEDIASTIHAHPTLSEALMEAAHDCMGEAIHMVK